MSCASCVVNIESVLGELPGVDRVDVTFGTERATVEYDPSRISPAELQSAVADAGYLAGPARSPWLGDRRGPRGGRASRRDRRPLATVRARCRADRPGRVRRDDRRLVLCHLDPRAAPEPLVPARRHHTRDDLQRVADPPDRVADPAAPYRRHELAHHHRHARRIRLQPPRDHCPVGGARGRTGGVLRSCRCHHHADPAGAAARSSSQGRDRRGHSKAHRPPSSHGDPRPRQHRDRGARRGRRTR